MSGLGTAAAERRTRAADFFRWQERQAREQDAQWAALVWAILGQAAADLWDATREDSPWAPAWREWCVADVMRFLRSPWFATLCDWVDWEPARIAGMILLDAEAMARVPVLRRSPGAR